MYNKHKTDTSTLLDVQFGVTGLFCFDFSCKLRRTNAVKKRSPREVCHSERICRMCTRSTPWLARRNLTHGIALKSFRRRAIFTSAKEVMFLPEFVCLCVSKITQKVMAGFF